MKRTYDFNKISIETGFNPVQIEKVLRISDILENISSVPFMRFYVTPCCNFLEPFRKKQGFDPVCYVNWLVVAFLP